MIVFLFLWIESRAKAIASVQLSLIDIATGTGLSRRTVQDALAGSSKRKLVSITRQDLTAVLVYTLKPLWIR